MNRSRDFRWSTAHTGAAAASCSLLLTSLPCLAQPAPAARATPGAPAAQVTYTVKLLAPETALAAAQAALAQCRQAGHQVTVAVVDRSGMLQVLLRDRYAGAHTIEAATQKAWTAASFRMPSGALANETQAGKAMSGIRAISGVMAIAGGQLIEAGGSALGAIGVSGAPGGEADDACALAGVRSIADLIEF